MSFKNQVKPRQITSWSPSRVALYVGCPAKAKYKYIDKLPEPESPSGSLGVVIHKAAENYVTSRQKTLIPHLTAPRIKALLNMLKADYKLKKVRVELELAFDAAWKPVGWFASDVRSRFKVDVMHLLSKGAAEVIDWKTGRLKEGDPEYDSQLSSYAVAALSSGLAESVKAKLAFTAANQIIEGPSGTLALGDLAKAQKEWDRRAKPMLTDTKFKPKPGNACTYCPYSANKGGPCEY